MGDWYHHLYELAESTNIAAHFLRYCEWPELAESASRFLVGRFAYGAQFAVRQERLSRIPRKSLELALQAANGHQVYGYILERLWLHICGEAFRLPAQMRLIEMGDIASPSSRFWPPSPMKSPFQRVMPAIKRRVSRWSQS